MTYPVFVFDWDGTLVDSEKHIVNSLSYAAQKMSLPDLGYDRFKRIIGLGMKEAIWALYPELTDRDVDGLRKHYSEFFFSQPVGSAQLFDGVEHVLSELKNAGFHLAVATGKSRNGLEKALDSTGLRAFFDITKCADETRSKPDPLMLAEISSHFSVTAKQMLMIGDTEYDLEMATNFGSPSVAVSHGVHDVEDLRKHQPIRVIDHLNDLLALT